MGDNPSNSTDSREFGVVPHDQIVGLVVQVFSF
ncbi:S26 family signal peptidase [Reinekea sp.]